MANEKLIYASDARRAILKADPRLAYLIDNIKGVDAVEVVRCKDCKHYGSNGRVWDCYRYGCLFTPDEDDFCSYGERREGE